MNKKVKVFIAGRDLNGVFQKIRLPFAGGDFLEKSPVWKTSQLYD